MIGKVVVNANGEKAISFDDAVWAALPVGATIYAARATSAPFKPCGRTVGHGSSCEMGYLCGSCKERLAQSRLIEGFEAEIERLRAELDRLEQACKEALPGVYYLDPPDGGDVSLGEQVLRMGKDAEHFRAQKPVKLPPTEYFGDSWSGGWAITRENIVDCLEEHGIKVADE